MFVIAELVVMVCDIRARPVVDIMVIMELLTVVLMRLVAAVMVTLVVIMQVILVTFA